MAGDAILTRAIFIGIFLFSFSAGSKSQSVNYSVSDKKITKVREISMPDRMLKKDSDGSFILSYDISDYNVVTTKTNNDLYQWITIKGFGKLQDIGAPGLPSRTEKLALPSDSVAEISVISSEYIELTGFNIHPVQPFEADGVISNEGFTINEGIYTSNNYYPGDVAALADIQIYKGTPLAFIKINPIQFNPVTGKVKIYTNISVKVSPEPDLKKTSGITPDKSDKLLRNIVINDIEELNPDKIFEKDGEVITDPIGYLIITKPTFRVAADSLAKWKSQLGFSVEIISRSSWTSTDVKNVIQNRYDNGNPRPGYFVIIGDQQDVPDRVKTYEDETWYMDVYYGCMDGPTDKIPDLGRGRIPVNNAEQAMTAVMKIINYERNPPETSSFYQKGLHCTYFQHKNDGYAEMRYTHTTEESRDYMLGQGFDIQRVYYTESHINPTNYNNGYFSNGEPIPAELRRDNGFAWDGDGDDIVEAVNDGRLYVFHRDHGLIDGWVAPEISVNDVDNMNNGGLLPVFFNVDCHSGSFQYSECFAEKLIKKENGGAVGVIGATQATYSGWNDALIEGFIDAIWPYPGLIPVFGWGGISDPEVTEHEPVYRMGDILNQGLFRMTETWDGWATERQYERFHYYGDPAMQIWTQIPVQITASHPAEINVGETSFSIYSSNCANGFATICFNNELQAKIQLSGGTGTFYFEEPINEMVTNVIITIYHHNYIPYVANIHTTAGLVPLFLASETEICPGSVVDFIDSSTDSPASWEWTIEPSGFEYINGTNKNSQNPSVRFTEAGFYDIKLKVENIEEIDSTLKVDFIEVYNAPDPPVVSDIAICDSGSVELNATGSTDIFQWWSLEEGGVLLSEEASYQTPVLDESTTYYVKGISEAISEELSTLFAHTNNSNGNMFDIIAHQDITVDSFDINIIDNLQHNVEIYYKQGTYVGFENNPAAWILLGDFTVFGNGLDNPARVRAGGLSVEEGETVGIYITLTDGNVGYTNSGVDANNDDITIDCGVGLIYPFGTVYSPRSWNGTVFYSKGEYLCSSIIEEVNVTVNTTPDPPSASDMEMCFGNPIPDLYAIGSNIKWYADPDKSTLLYEGATFLPDDVEIGANLFYASQSSANCESNTRQVELAVGEVPDIPVANDFEFCYNNDGIEIYALGTSHRWYIDPAGDLLLSTEDTLRLPEIEVGEGLVYVSNISGICESDLKEIAVIRHPAIELPLTRDYEFCENETNINLVADGNVIRWYSSYIEKDMILESDTLNIPVLIPGTFKFYVTNMVGNCESDFDTVTIVVHELPEAPEVDDIEICEGDNEVIFAEGENIRWYTDSGASNLIYEGNYFTPEELKTGENSYYVSKTINNCESETEGFIVWVNELPEFSLGNDTILYPDENLLLECATSGSYLWFNLGTGSSYNFVVNDHEPGDYNCWLEVVSEEGCYYSDTIKITVYDPDLTHGTIGLESVRVYPNPTDGLLNIECNGLQELNGKIALRLYNNTGQLILSREILSLNKTEIFQFDLTEFPEGVYHLIIDDSFRRFEINIVLY
ncbi:MAG: hypothetical protein JW894_08470 [Bacteroidales bacterium]|nr:hypothetical protein [Bacteroidales bacterium]